MTKHNANNVRIKHKYFAFLKEAKGLSVQSVDAVASAINRFEIDTRHRDFKDFHFEQAIAFKKHLAEQKGQRSGKNLSKASTMRLAREGNSLPSASVQPLIPPEVSISESSMYL